MPIGCGAVAALPPQPTPGEDASGRRARTDRRGGYNLIRNNFITGAAQQLVVGRPAPANRRRVVSCHQFVTDAAAGGTLAVLE